MRSLTQLDVVQSVSEISVNAVLGNVHEVQCVIFSVPKRPFAVQKHFVGHFLDRRAVVVHGGASHGRQTASRKNKKKKKFKH